MRLFRDGRPVDEPSLVDFIETRPGQPLSTRQVRESLTQLFSLREFIDVRASAAAVAQGVSLRYDLVPFRGAGGMEVFDPRGRPVEEEAALVRHRLGSRVAPDQVDDAAARPPAPDGRLIINVDPGPAARMGSIEVRSTRARSGPAGSMRRTSPTPPSRAPDGLKVSLDLEIRTGAQVARGATGLVHLHGRPGVRGGHRESALEAERRGHGGTRWRSEVSRFPWMFEK